MEKLLNKLIEKGWKPRHIECTSVKSTDYCLEFYTKIKQIGWMMKNERQLVSKESWLWQFVCENKLYKYEFWWIYVNDERAKNVYYKIDQFDEEWDIINTDVMKWDVFIWMNEPEYRLIESALKDESELEQFLLDNIKIEW